jgi:hypothetical protein
MYKLILIGIIFFTNLLLGQTKTTYKNKSGNTIGHSKQNGNKTTYYNKSGNKTGTSKKSSNGTTIFYNKQGNKILTSKTK